MPVMLTVVGNGSFTLKIPPEFTTTLPLMSKVVPVFTSTYPVLPTVNVPPIGVDVVVFPFSRIRVPSTLVSCL
jgi:hypothetical protein